MIYLADANLLIASALTNHDYHQAARKWFSSKPRFATTPITELALISVATHKNYGLGLEKALVALELIQRMPNRIFWPADLEITIRFLNGGTLASSQTTDAYLLALAKKNGGKLVTFDQGIKVIARNTENYLEVLKP